MKGDGPRGDDSFVERLRFSGVKLLAYGVMSNHFASREYLTKAYLRPLTEAGLIARTDPDHP